MHSVSVTMDGVASELCAGRTYERKNVMPVMPQYPFIGTLKYQENIPYMKSLMIVSIRALPHLSMLI